MPLLERLYLGGTEVEKAYLGAVQIYSAITAADLPTASDASSSTLEGADPFALDLLSLASAQGSDGGTDVQLYSATVQSGGGSITASFPVAYPGTISVDPNVAEAGTPIVVEFVVEDVGNEFAAYRITRTLTISVAEAAAEPPAALTAGDWEMEDANASGGTSVRVRIIAAPTSDAPIEEYALTTEDTAVDGESTLYSLSGTEEATWYIVEGLTQDVEASLKLVARSTAGWSGLSDVKTVRPSKPLDIAHVGGGTEWLAEVDVDATLTITPASGGPYSATIGDLIDLFGATAIPLGAPQVFGTAQVGATLSVQRGDWAYLDGDTLATGQWHRDGSPISGETGNDYVVDAADAGTTLTFVESADGNDNVSNEVAIPAGSGVTVTPTVDGFTVEDLPLIAAFDVITPTADGFTAEQS